MVAKSRTIKKSQTMICGTRYGNVMASRGSVIPLFLRQIFCNQPISVTDPEMTRFMMTLDDAVDLVLHAFNNGINGDIFVQKAPAATIDVLIKALLSITDKKNFPVEVIGTRHGEKLFEALCSREEMFTALDQGNYYRIPSDNRDLNYSKYNDEGDRDLSKVEDYNSHNTERLDVDAMIKLLKKLDFINDIESGGKDVPEGV
jgi:UDP-glucose 4-epimerase